MSGLHLPPVQFSAARDVDLMTRHSLAFSCMVVRPNIRIAFCAASFHVTDFHVILSIPSLHIFTHTLCISVPRYGKPKMITIHLCVC